jgi:muconolactone delta-isomerase
MGLLASAKQGEGNMQFLTVSRRSEKAEVSGDELRPAEVQRVRVLYSEGHIRQLWHRADSPGACILWEAESENQLREMSESLPFVQAGIVEVSVFPLRPYRGFGLETTS